MKKMKRFLALLLVLAMALSLLPATVFATEAETVTVNRVGGTDPGRNEGNVLEQGQALKENQPERAQAGTVSVEKIEKPEAVGELTLEGQAAQREEPLYSTQETVRVIVVLEEPGLLESGFETAAISSDNAQVTAAKRRMLDSQEAVLQSIDTLAAQAEGEAVVRYNYTVAVNGMALELPYGALAQVQALEGVKTAFVAPQYKVPEDMSDDPASPLVHATTGAVGATQTWDIGYTGAGMRIAIIDTGLDVDHPSFAAAPAEPSLTLEELESVVTSLNAARAYNGLTAQKVYYSEKLPYIFNYVDGTLDVTHDNDQQGDHGTHVAGIAAANRLEGTEVVGVAPDAQLLIMKVFGATGGAYFDDILACMEDCYALNVDVANLSLGTPAGFSSISAEVDEIFARILESDMVVAIAAGNSNSAALMNGWGTDRNLTSDPDNGIVSSPSTYTGGISVASVENVAIRYNYAELEDGTQIPYNDVAATALTSLYWLDTEHRAEYVMVPGYGTTEDFAGLSPTVNEAGERLCGISIAVIQRGGADFTAKQTNAALAGFDACIVYNNVEEGLLNMVDAGQIPNVFVSLASGLALAEAAGEDGWGFLYLKGPNETATVPNSLAGRMSDFSSWGVTPDLQLAPEVTAPGGNIYSTLTNGHYGMMSGTSMASPQIAGMGALVLEYLHETYPELTEAQLHTIAEALLISTAVPVEEAEGLPYSPRKQGSGSANVLSAVTSPVYLTAEQANGEQTPKISFGDDDGKTGVYTFHFHLNNLSDEARSFALAGQAMTDQFQEINGMKFMSETSRALGASFTFSAGEEPLPLRYDYNEDGVTDMADVTALLDAVNGLSELKAGFDLSGDGLVDTADVQLLYVLVQANFDDMDVVEVPAKGRRTVTVTLTLSAADKAYMDENYPNGIYVDAFVRAYALDAGGVDLSLPVLGFYGDWSAAPAIDDAWYYDVNAVPDRYINVLFTDYGTTAFNLGLNPYIWEDYDPAHNVLSPNGDGYSDKLIEIYLGMMRNTKRTDFTWLGEDGEVLFSDSYDYSLKNYYFPAAGYVPPLAYTASCVPYDFRKADGSYAVEELERVQLQISALLDDGDEAADQVITTDIVIDTQAPVLDVSSMDYFYSEKTDARLLRFTVSDNYDIAAVVPLTRGGAAYEYIPVNTKVEGVDGESITITLDVSDYDEVFQIAVCDYGTNESYYEISFSAEKNYSEDRFYAYRLFSAVPDSGNIYLTEAYNGWHSFASAEQMLMHTSMFEENETYTYAAEYVDGYVIGVDANNTIYAMKLGRWDRTDLGKLEAEIVMEFYPGGYELGDYYMMNAEFPALDMALDYSSNTLYVLTDESMYLGPNTGGHLLTLDWLTGEVTYVAKVTGLTDDHQALTLACDNEGVLYTVDAMNGDLYTLDKTTGVATFVGATGYVPLYQQSMAVDHETNKLYWAAYQDFSGVSALYEVDKATGELLSSTPTQYNSQLSGLFKPWDVDSSLIPDDVAATGLRLKEGRLTLRSGDSATLHPLALPYYAALNAEEITWTSSDPAVATVENGVVTAVGKGEAVITAELGGLQAACTVEVIALEGQLYVFDFGTDNNTTYSWLTMDVNEPGKAAVLTEAMSLPAGVTAAAHVQGAIYAYDSNGGFWKYDAATMQAEQIREGKGEAVIAMAFNYADGYMYAIRYDGTSSFALCQVNLRTGELRSVMDSLEMMYGTPLGGMAIDYEGRFYFMNLDANGALRLDSFKLFYDFWMYNPEGYVSASLPGLNCSSFSSLTWSETNDGLFWANDQAQLYWIGAEVATRFVESEWGGYEESYLEASPVLLGNVANTLSPVTGMAMNMGLLEIPASEPALPEVPLQSAAMPESITVPAGGAAPTELAVEPWNAQYTVTYEMADESIATVDASGIIHGVNPGETTLTVTVYHADGSVFQTLSSHITSVFSDVDLYMFLITDFAAGGNAWIRMNAANPDDRGTEALYDFTVYAAAYYDGKIYAVAASEEHGYKNHLMRIDCSSFVVEEVYPDELSFNIRDMAFDYTTGTMYAIAEGGTVIGGVAQLDLSTGEATLVADSGMVIAAMSCDAEGQLYAITEDGSLNRLDKYTAALEPLGRIGNVPAGYQGMHYDHDTGNTYWANQLGIYLLDLEKCGKTSLGSSGGSVGSLLTMPENEPEAPAATPVTGVSLPERAAVVKGDILQLSATVLPVSVAEVDQTLTWSSSDSSIATVDENGLVTGLADGSVTITVTAGDYSAQCVVTVLAEAQKFYAYNETAKSWVQINTETGELTTVKEETGVAPIMAAADTGETIYAYDDEGYFYSIDPTTFERSKLSDGIHGMTQDCFDGWDYYTVDVDITDLSYDPESGRLFGSLNGLYEDTSVGLWLIYSALVEVNLTEGRLNPYTYEAMDVGDLVFIQTFDATTGGIYRPGNLLVKDGYAYSVDTWVSGILSRVSLTWDPWMESWYAGSVERLAHVNQLEWGMFFDSRSLVYDPVFDVTYTIHDLGLDDNGNPRSAVTLNTINLGNASTTEVCELGKGIVINSLIIR